MIDAAKVGEVAEVSPASAYKLIDDLEQFGILKVKLLLSYVLSPTGVGEITGGSETGGEKCIMRCILDDIKHSLPKTHWTGEALPKLQ